MESRSAEKTAERIALHERLQDLDRDMTKFLGYVLSGDVPFNEFGDTDQRSEQDEDHSLLAEMTNAKVNYHLITRFLEKQVLSARETEKIIENIHFLCGLEETLPKNEPFASRKNLVKNLSASLHELVADFKARYPDQMFDS